MAGRRPTISTIAVNDLRDHELPAKKKTVLADWWLDGRLTAAKWLIGRLIKSSRNNVSCI